MDAVNNAAEEYCKSVTGNTDNYFLKNAFIAGTQYQSNSGVQQLQVKADEIRKQLSFGCEWEEQEMELQADLSAIERVLNLNLATTNSGG